MPEVDGFDVVEALGENALTNEIPIMILTAKQLTEADVAQLSGHVATIIERGSIEDVDLLAKLVAALNKPVVPA
jgi:threonine synthase